ACEDYWTRVRYSAEGTPQGARRPAQPADPVPPAEHRSPRLRRAGRQLIQALPDEWRRGVGRPARQSGGEFERTIRTYRRRSGAKGTNQVYPPCTVRIGAEEYRTARCSIARRRSSNQVTRSLVRDLPRV